MVSLKNLNVYTNGNFFLEIQSDGSIVPTIFNRDFVTVKKYTINRQDTFTGNLWQKSNKKIVSNRDEESAKKFADKYKSVSYTHLTLPTKRIV